jgi:DNA ligase-1
MLAENFIGGKVLFHGDSGQKIHNKWKFTNKPSCYAVDPTNWYMSEKLDGVRAFWNSETGFHSRNNNAFHAPLWFDSKMKSCCDKNWILDGELYIQGKDASFVSGTVRRKNSEKDWDTVCFFVFDIIGTEGNFEERTNFLKSLLSKCNDELSQFDDARITSNFIYLPQIKVKNMEHAYEFYKHIITSNGEGIVLKDSNSLYEHKRSHKLLKWKPVPTAEAKVIGFLEGTGKYKNKLGTFLVSNGKEFHLSGKMTDQFRSQYVFKNHKLDRILSDSVPHMNDYVTYEYMTLTSHGIPRQAVFVGLRILKD